MNKIFFFNSNKVKKDIKERVFEAKAIFEFEAKGQDTVFEGCVICDILVG